MKPCDNCSIKEHCRAAKFVEDHVNQSPWKLDSYLYEHFVGVNIISMISGDLDSIKLECGDYKPIKSEADYSHLTRRVKKTEPKPPSKCGSCKGNCK